MSQIGVLESKPAVAFLYKVAIDRQSLWLVPLQWQSCLIFDEVNFPRRAGAICSVRRGASLLVSVVLRAWMIAP